METFGYDYQDMRWSSTKFATSSKEHVAKKRGQVMPSIMTSRQAAELDHAMERNGFTADMVKKLSEGETLGKVLDVLEGRAKIKYPERVFKTWKTIKLGMFKDTNKICEALKSSRLRISEYASDIMDKSDFTVEKTEKEVELVNVSVAEMGFKNGALYTKILNRAIELGLELCPPEAGPQLRLQYKDQPKNDWVMVAMEPIVDSAGDFCMFRVGRDGDGDQWLHIINGYTGHFWPGNVRFVFVCRK